MTSRSFQFAFNTKGGEGHKTTKTPVAGPVVLKLLHILVLTQLGTKNYQDLVHIPDVE